MKLDEQIAARVPKVMKRRLALEVRRRRATGEGVQEADITREALIEYFARRSPSAQPEGVAA